MSDRQEPTTLEYALLGLVAMKKQSAYAIKSVFTDTPMAQFSSSPGSIYPALARLEKRKLLHSRPEPGERGRARKIYAATKAGFSTLDAWLRRDPTLEEVESDIRTIMLRFSYMHGRLQRREVIEFLHKLRETLGRHLKDIEKLRADFRSSNAVHAALTLECGAMGVRSHIRWADKAARLYESGEI